MATYWWYDVHGYWSFRNYTLPCTGSPSLVKSNEWNPVRYEGLWCKWIHWKLSGIDFMHLKWKSKSLMRHVTPLRVNGKQLMGNSNSVKWNKTHSCCLVMASYFSTRGSVFKPIIHILRLLHAWGLLVNLYLTSNKAFTPFVYPCLFHSR